MLTRSEKRRLLKLNALYAEMLKRTAESTLNEDMFNLPREYRDLLDDESVKYLAIKGGRGSVKSFSVASKLIELSFDEHYAKCGFLCGREIQKSIDDSVYGLIKMLIDQAQLTDRFKFQKNEIKNTDTGVRFLFTGLRATGGATAASQLNKMKGKVNIKIVWIDEAQDLSEDVINTLFPTVTRGSSSGVIQKSWHKLKTNFDVETRMFFTMNPVMPLDPILAKLETLSDQSVILHKNIFDLDEQFQDEQLIIQAAQEEKEAYYKHVWLGEPMSLSGGFPFIDFEFIDSIRSDEIECFCMFEDPSFKGGDYTAIAFLGEYEDRLISWGYCFPKAWNNAIDDVVELYNKYKPQVFWYEDNGIGSTLQNEFAKHNINVVAKTSVYNKHTRIYKAATFTANKVAIVKSESNSAFITNLMQYCGERSKHDDGADAYASVIIQSGIVADKIKW